MQPTILITNNGPHPPSLWALRSAEQIVDSSAITDDRVIQAHKLRCLIAEALEPRYAEMIELERGLLANDPSYILTPFNSSAFVIAAMDDLLELTNASPWRDHFHQAAVIEVVYEILGRHLASALRVERLWNADSRPDCPIAQQYKLQTTF